MSPRPLDITVTAHTSATPEQVLAAAVDFSDRRPRLWPHVKAKYLQVHATGTDFADVTAGIFILGVFWERERYDWSEPGVVRAVVTDSNVIDSGSRFELRATSIEGGSEVEMVLYRTFRRGVRGRVGRTLNHVSGHRGWRMYLRRVLRQVERHPEGAGLKTTDEVGQFGRRLVAPHQPRVVLEKEKTNLGMAGNATDIGSRRNPD